MYPHGPEGPAGLLLGRADAEQPLIASRALPRHFPQGIYQPRQFAPPDRSLLGPPPFAM
jgi:hypothetical protein